MSPLYTRRDEDLLAAQMCATMCSRARNSQCGHSQVSPLYTRRDEDLLAAQMCASAQRHDVLTFQLPPGWRDGGRQCVAAVYQTPQLFGLDDPRAPVLRAPWARCRKLLINKKEAKLAPMLRPLERGASYVPRLLPLDDLVVHDGDNRLDFFTHTGERVCVAVMLVAPRPDACVRTCWPSATRHTSA